MSTLDNFVSIKFEPNHKSCQDLKYICTFFNEFDDGYSGVSTVNNQIHVLTFILENAKRFENFIEICDFRISAFI